MAIEVSKRLRSGSVEKDVEISAGSTIATTVSVDSSQNVVFYNHADILGTGYVYCYRIGLDGHTFTVYLRNTSSSAVSATMRVKYLYTLNS